jgi:amidophosphoribosyltransferase
MLDKLGPKRIVVVSSAPQIRYPDCYGIDMSKMHDFITFRALLALLEDHGKKKLLRDVFKKCKKSIKNREANPKNHVRELYKQFTPEQLSDKIAEIIKGDNVKADVSVVYQTVSNLHEACPNHIGDWYFTGKYPTQGGNRVVNMAFFNFMSGHGDRRAY